MAYEQRTLRPGDAFVLPLSGLPASFSNSQEDNPAYLHPWERNDVKPPIAAGTSRRTADYRVAHWQGCCPGGFGGRGTGHRRYSGGCREECRGVGDRHIDARAVALPPV